MIRIATNWEKVEFHDAVVDAIHEKDSTITLELSSVKILPGHPANKKNSCLVLPKSHLRFINPRTIVVRSYVSSKNRWTEEEKPYPHMKEIAEIELDSNKWHVTGFDNVGRWLEWIIEGSSSVQLDTR